MLKDTAARRGLAVLFATLIILAIDLLFAPYARAQEPVKAAPPVAALLIAQCGKIVAVAVTDAQGNLHPVPPEALNDSVMASLLQPIPEASRIVATVKCDNSTAT